MTYNTYNEFKAVVESTLFANLKHLNMTFDQASDEVLREVAKRPFKSRGCKGHNAISAMLIGLNAEMALLERKS